ncbi:hypothetical protein A2U01_0045254, partial [Trifolium medium]|nr:hypothetical protein [Trifolium medium]
EMVLGMDWLASLGNIEANFGNLCLKWEVEGRKYLINGDPAMCNRQASWKAMMRALSNEGLGFYVHKVESSSADEKQSEQSNEWDQLLGEFDDIFHMPTGLPPARDHDHAITLKADATVPNLRPYSFACQEEGWRMDILYGL